MDKEPELDDRSIDDELAEFTDRILSQDPEEMLELTTQHPQLRSLEEIVIVLKRLFPTGEPDPETANRIHTHLKSEWNRSRSQTHLERPRKQEPARHPLAGWEQFLNLGRKRKYALSFALLAIVILVVVWLLAPDFDANLTATAGGGTDLLPLILILAVVAGIAALIAIFRARH